MLPANQRNKEEVMRKKITALTIAVLFSLTFASVSLASKCKGSVVSNEDGKLVIELDKKCKAKHGDSVTIKVKKGAAIEGC